MKEWTKLPFISMDDAIFTALETWPQEWCTPDLAGMEKAIAQQRKKETKLHIMQLVEKRLQEQEAATQQKKANAAAAAQTVETTTVPIKEAERGQEMSTR